MQSTPTQAALYVPIALGGVSPRKAIDPVECADTAVLELEGIAIDVTPKSLMKSRPYRHTNYVRVGEIGLNLSHEHEPGWPIAMKLQTGARYRVQVFACLKAVKSVKELPIDTVTRDSEGEVTSLTFYSIGRNRSNVKDFADRRRSCKGHVGVWTDGVMVTTGNTAHKTPLRPEAAYKVVVERLSPPA